MIPLAQQRDQQTPALTDAMRKLVGPGRRYIGAKEALMVLAGVDGARLVELGSVPLGAHGQRLCALRYFLPNGATWLRYYSWRPGLEKADPAAPQLVLNLDQFLQTRRTALKSQPSALAALSSAPLLTLAEKLEDLSLTEGKGIDLLILLEDHADARAALRARLEREALPLLMSSPRAADLLYLATFELTRFPATTVGAGDLKYLIVADKGEMGVRATREAIRLGICPVVLFSKTDDEGCLQVRLAEAHGGFGIPLLGSFRESYASYEQIAQRVLEAYAERFVGDAEAELARSALYPGYGPLAENTAAIEHFRKSGIVFVGPMQDVVEQAGDKRKFRLIAESIEKTAVVPGIVMDESDPEAIVARIAEGHKAKKFSFPGRLKAANGGGGRGQMVIPSPDLVETAVRKVLAEIRANGWDPGVMFEQNIPETVHLEVQIVRDRFGNTRHFGMRDCTEQRASQKIQEEAPPALLRHHPELTKAITRVAVQVADHVGYVGACTVELMYKSGHYYLLEMNTRIQVEHPVTEAAHRIRTRSGLVPLNLVELQLLVARGEAIPFAQDDIIATHVAREFRINAESWKSDVKDSRDGQKGLFVPNAGEFTKIRLHSAEEVKSALEGEGVQGIDEITVRLDSGFEEGDRLLNKDPTFAKLIVAVKPKPGHEESAYELLRLASIATLQKLEIEGNALLPSGKVQEGVPFQTNIADHIKILESDMLKTHSQSTAPNRHVNWVVQMLRQS